MTIHPYDAAPPVQAFPESIPRSESTRQTCGFLSDDFILGYIGRFSGEKQVDLLIDAVADLPPRFQLLLVGWGPGRQTLMERANALIPGRHVFLWADRYLGDYDSVMDAFCLVSNQGAFSLALLEAMLCGCSVIATPVGSAPEVIEDRVNGVLVDQNRQSIAAAARLLAEHPHWARGLAAEGRNFTRHQGHALRMTRDYEKRIESLWIDRFGTK